MNVTLALSLALACAPIGALATSPAPGAAQRQAEQAYAAGRAAFKAEDYPTALRHFETAFKLDPVPVLLYNLARCHEMMGQAERAIDNFELYLTRAPDAPDRADVTRRIKVMQAIVDRERAGATPPEPARRPAAPGLGLHPVAPPGPGLRALAPPAPAPRPHTLRWVSLGLMGAGVAGLAVGGGFRAAATTAAADQRAALNDADKADATDQAERAQTTANVGFIAGGALLAVGAGLLTFDLMQAGADTQVQLVPHAGGAGFALGGTF